jgi:hypothetical protein
MITTNERNEKPTAEHISLALAQRYCAPKFCYLRNVRSSTGYVENTVRTADGVAMGMYPSEGLHFHGFEIKVTKADFKREFESSDKSERIGRYMNYWWVVAPSGVLKRDDVPEQWGLLELRGSELFVVRRAPFEAAEQPPLHFVASLLRASEAKFSDDEARIRIQNAHRDGVNEGIARQKKSDENEIEKQRAKVETLESACRDFYVDSGIDIFNRGWNPKMRHGQAVKYLMEQGTDFQKHLREIHEKTKQVDRLLQNLIEETK